MSVPPVVGRVPSRKPASGIVSTFVEKRWTSLVRWRPERRERAVEVLEPRVHRAADVEVDGGGALGRGRACGGASSGRGAGVAPRARATLRPPVARVGQREEGRARSCLAARLASCRGPPPRGGRGGWRRGRRGRRRRAGRPCGWCSTSARLRPLIGSSGGGHFSTMRRMASTTAGSAGPSVPHAPSPSRASRGGASSGTAAVPISFTMAWNTSCAVARPVVERRVQRGQVVRAGLPALPGGASRRSGPLRVAVLVA